MSKTLLVAEATFDRAAPHIGGIFLGMSVTLIVGVGILRLGLPVWLTVPLLLALLVGVALVKARFGPPEMRVEKLDDDDGVRIAGRFANASIAEKRSRNVARAVIEDDGDLRIDFSDAGEPESVWLRQPSFKAASLRLLAEAIGDLAQCGREDVRRKYRQERGALKIYDAKGLLLFRLTERPSYMAMTWLIAGLTVLFWMLLAPLLIGPA